ncbi:MAG: cupredoxin domain-containing protein [Solirubrobacterales bacterium]
MSGLMLRAWKLITACAAACALLGVAAAAAKAPGKPSKPTLVTVNDDYFEPNAVTVKKGGSVKWIWSSNNIEPHDVHLRKWPKGLKRKGSYSTKTTAVTEAQWKDTFPTPGTYKFICTIHPTEMKLTVTVKK